MRDPVYHRYAGKALPGGNERCHLLAYHSLDVAAVGWHLLSPDRRLSQRLADALDIALPELRRFLVFWLGLHDLGKFSRAFQGLLEIDWPGMVGSLGMPYVERHDRLGAVLWQAHWLTWWADGTLGYPGGAPDRTLRRALSGCLPIVAAPFFGHHGQPVAAGSVDIEAFFGVDERADDRAAASVFVADWAQLVEPAWPVDRLVDRDWQATFKLLSWTIAGWATLSDWLGSHRGHFPYRQTPMPLGQYWPVALKQAESVLADVGLARVPTSVAYTGLAHWFESEVVPTPLQAACETVTLNDRPQMFVLEDMTGAGKTEAACILAQRMLAAGQGDGLYFALPTMATSNAMYARLGALHRKFFDDACQPSLVLAHGARELNTDFSRALMAAQPAEVDYATDDTSATTRCNQWFGDSRKKALLADVGVGTIDQVLMGLLPFRHQSLRLYGLARKVLIVDEVHAYDLYMQTLLEQLLTHHARQGGSAILLTATLPQSMRQALVSAWRAGLNAPAASIAHEAFPLSTQVSADGVAEQPVDARAGIARCVAVEWLDSEEQAVDMLVQAVSAGECIAWIRNTVDDAIRAYEKVRARHPEPERCILFHSRFAMIDRQAIESAVIARFGKMSTEQDRRGWVLISTQVFQESLDCDADRMISDIAPIDLLIQRAGRLQRHARGARAAARLQVLAPGWTDTPDAEWVTRVLPGTQAVYRDTALLWLTQRVLRSEGVIKLPERARTLIESVYGAVGETIPDDLLTGRYEQISQQRMAGSMATFNALSLDDGYCRDLDFDPWQQERDIGTRLSDEPVVQVVLLSEDADGALSLWAGDVPHAPMLSQCRLRQSQAARLAELSAAQQTAWAHLIGEYKGLAYCRPWIVADDPGCYYDPQRGLLFDRASVDARKNA